MDQHIVNIPHQQNLVCLPRKSTDFESRDVKIQIYLSSSLFITPLRLYEQMKMSFNRETKQ